MQFEALVSSLDHCLGIPAAALEATFKTAAAHMQLPSPCKSEHQARLLLRLIELCKMLEITARHRKRHIWNLLKFFQANPDAGIRISRLLDSIMNWKEVEGIYEEVAKIEKDMEKLLDDKRSDEGSGTMEGDQRKDGFGEVEGAAMLLPLQDICTLREMHHKMADLSITLLDKK